MIQAIAHTLFLLFYAFLSLNVLYLLFAAITGHLRKRSSPRSPNHYRKIAVLITSHKEDSVIVNTVQYASTHDYPLEYFDVYVAADKLQPSTIQQLRTTRATVFEVDFLHGSKARSLNYLLNQIDEKQYEIALVLDGDNIMKAGVLHKINAAFEDGAGVVQVHRMAKNMHTPVAILDAVSEEVNNHLFRQAPSNLGLSASLIGSGMAFPFSVLKKVYNKPGIIDNPACDREVDFEMLVENLKVHYIDNAYVLDEKVAATTVYEKQRRRWLESQLMHAKLFFSDGKRVKNKSGDFWNKLFITLLPPRLLMLGAFFVVFCVAMAQVITGRTFSGIPAIYWLLLIFFYCISILISIPRFLFNRKTFYAFSYLPVLFFSFLKAAFTIRFNRKEFIHTPKSFTGNSATTNHDK